MFTAINALNSQWKAEVVGRLMRGSILRDGTVEHLLRLVDMVQVAYATDLRYLLDRTTTNTPFDETGDEEEHLLASGFLIRPLHKFGSSVMANVQPELSGYGRLFVDFYNTPSD
jgi:hypothetical protein